MKYIRRYWIYIIAALFTIIGLVTGWYLFIFLVLPFGLLKFGNKNDDEEP